MSNIHNLTPTFWTFDNGPAPPGAIMASFTEADLCSDSIKIEVPAEDCNGSTVNPIFFEPQWQPIAFEISDEYNENGYKQRKLVRKVVKRIHSFMVICDEYMRTNVYQLAYQAESLKMTRELIEYNMYHVNVSDKPFTEDNDLFEVIIAFETDFEDLSDFGASGCCTDLYSEAPHQDPCGIGPGGTDPDCVGITFEIQRIGDELHGIYTGAPGGSYVEWLYRAPGGTWVLLAPFAPSVTLGGFGEYKAILHAQDCLMEDIYVYSSTCTGFEVDIRQAGSTLIADITGGTAPYSYEWHKYNSTTGDWDLQGTGATLVLTENGIYQLKLTDDDGCITYDAIDVTLISVCSLDFDLDRIDDTLVISNVTDSPYTIVWTLYDGNGATVLIDTDETLNLQGDGLYQAEVTANGCTTTKTILVMDDTEAISLYQRIEATEGQSEFEITEFTLPSPGTHTVQEISYLLDVYVNQVHMIYDEDITNGYTIDFGNHKIITNISWPAGSIFEAKRRAL